MEIWTVLLLSFLPGAGNFAGGMFAEFRGTSARMLSFALHAASGIVIGIIAIELMPEALGKLAGWWIAAAVAGGGIAYVLVGAVVERLQARGGGEDRTSMWMIYIAVAVDLMSDGLMIGAGSAVSTNLAIVLAAGQVMADIPEGYASIAEFRENKVERRRRILLSASFILFSVGAAILSYLLLRGAGEGLKVAALAFVAGMLAVAAVEDMIEEAHEAREDTRGSVLAFVGGFALFVLISAGLETALGSGPQGQNGPEGGGEPSQSQNASK